MPCEQWPADAISGWFDNITAAKLLSADMVILAQLQERIATGGRWWRQLPSIGRTKAQRIAAHLSMLMAELRLPLRDGVLSSCTNETAGFGDSLVDAAQALQLPASERVGHCPA